MVYKNTYLERIGELMRHCMDLAKTVDEAMNDIKNMSADLRNPERVAEMFRMDSEFVIQSFMSGVMTEEEARDTLKRLRLYVLNQLQKHFELVVQLLKDTEKKVCEVIENTIKEVQTELPKEVMEEIEYNLKKAREDLDVISKGMRHD